jgi:hypothetical protein
VRSDGFFRLFRIESDFGPFEAASEFGLRERIQEIRALAALREVAATPHFAAALEVARREPCVERWHLLEAPASGPEGVPAAARQEILRIDSIPPDARTPVETEQREAVLGFDAARRRLARRLGVSPYTSNPVLSAALQPAAWATSAGGLPLAALPDLRGSSVAPLPEDVVPGARLEALYQQDSPEDLRRLNRLELAVLGVQPSLADRFLDHPAFTPRTATGVVESLVALEPARDRYRFVEQALAARSEADALFYLMAALVLRAEHGDDERIARVLALGERGVAGLATDGTLIVPAPVDELLWTRPVRRFADSVAAARPGADVVRAREVRATGRVSALARKELEARGIRVEEGVFRRIFERLADAPRGEDARAPLPARTR